MLALIAYPRCPNRVEESATSMNRRTFNRNLALALPFLPGTANSQSREARQNSVTEWSFTSGKSYRDPFNDLELDVVFSGPGGEERVPAFWAGEQTWRVRYAAKRPGRY